MSYVDFAFYPALFSLLLTVATGQHVLKNSTVSNTVSKSALLLFSYVVICCYDFRFGLCITAVVLITYFAVISIEKTEKRSKRRVITTLSVVVLSLFLGVFKYLNFFMSSIMTIFCMSWTNLNIILPIGISFYIFSAIGYILDVSWGNIPAEKSLLDVALFLTFFPKLVCGPIVNGRDFLPQLKEDRRVSLKNIEIGTQVFVFGLFKKIVLADRIAVFVNDVYAVPGAYGTLTIWLAVFSYYIQLYFDFSGYSDMAIGVSKVFGYDIKRNFNLPFIARNISEFWNRWHISLSTWLNEYIFNPIAIKFKREVAQLPKDKRKRYKMLPTYAALLITFLVSGIWHGAGFNYIAYGLCHGVYSIVHSVYANWMKKHHKDFAENKSRAVILLDILANYFVINIIQVLFRAGSLSDALYIYKRMFIPEAGVEQPYVWTFLGFAVLLIATLTAVKRSAKMDLTEVEGYYPIQNLGTVPGLFLFFLLIGFTILLSYIGETYFIYGQF